jgi:single-strand DNA-binding protein
MKIITKANLSQDIKVIPTSNGTTMVAFSVADNRFMGRNPDNSPKTKVVFVECVAFGKLADYLIKFAQKGSGIFFEAELDYNVFKHEKGVNIPKVSFVLQTAQVISKQKPQDGQTEAPAQAKQPEPQRYAEPKPTTQTVVETPIPDNGGFDLTPSEEDEIPF